jgi:hypothetical protein
MFDLTSHRDITNLMMSQWDVIDVVSGFPPEPNERTAS